MIIKLLGALMIILSCAGFGFCINVKNKLKISELKNMNDNKYGVVNFFDYPSEPIIESMWKRGDKELPIYELHRIAGTVISKNDVRHSITLLTKYIQDYGT